jgi:glycosyltransferase involved in cell wall biosynthesis
VNPISIDVNGRYLTRRSTGIERFAAELLEAWLTAHGGSRDVRFLLPQSGDPGERAPKGQTLTRVGTRSGHVWEQFDLPRNSRGRFLLNLCNAAPLAKRDELVVLHDANVMANPAMFGFAYRSWHRLLSTALMRRAAVVATVSKFSADELQRHFGPRERGVEIIYESGEHILRTAAEPGILERLRLTGRRYVLAVGSRTLNKNFAGIVAAAALLDDLDIQIVAAGGSNDRVFGGAPIATENLVLAGYVSDGELRALYEHAECFVFPSFYEGFGLPPLEAMQCGCPALVANRSALPEVCGRAAAYCDPADPADIARQLRRILDSTSLREDLRGAGFERVREFTWSKSADALEALLPQG